MHAYRQRLTHLARRATSDTPIRILSSPRHLTSDSPSRMSSSSPTVPVLPSARLEIHDGGVAVITLDSQGERVNILNNKLMTDIEPILARLETDETVRSAVIISAKADDFIAGADITMFDTLGDSAASLAALSTTGQSMMSRIAAISKRKPVVAAINGNCLGGGVELALACSYRIATNSPKTKLGLPEVKLGLVPGAGGTQRLPKLVGIQESLKIMTTGSNVKPDRALKMGLVNAVVEKAALEGTAVHAARELAAGRLKPAAPKPLDVMGWLLEGNPIGRNILFSGAKKAVEKATKGHYLAPGMIIDVVQAGVEGGLTAGFKAESEAFGKLGVTSISKALRGVFFSDVAAKRAAASFGKPAFPVETIGVLGAGLMGAGIAQVSAVAGLRVMLKDRDAAAVARGEKQIGTSLVSTFCFTCHCTPQTRRLFFYHLIIITPPLPPPSPFLSGGTSQAPSYDSFPTQCDFI